MKYAFFGEISFQVSDQKSQGDVMSGLRKKYSDASINSLDRLRFFVRKSGSIHGTYGTA